MSGIALAASGDLDPSFDGDGKKTIDYGGDERTRDMAVQPDGKIVLVGKGVEGQFAITRLNPDGSFDPSLGGDGALPVEFGGTSSIAHAVALQWNGKVVVSGYTGTADIAVARLQPGGTLDTTFSFDGKMTIDFGAEDVGYALTVQGDGKIVVAGDSGISQGNLGVARLEGDRPPGGGAGPVTVPRCAGRRATIVGTTRKDVLRGTRKADVIVSAGGNDTIKGGRGGQRPPQRRDW